MFLYQSKDNQQGIESQERSSSDRTTMAACSSTSCQKSSKKRLPNSISDLLDVATFTFACQTGLRSCHRIRGNPLLEGVCAFQLLQKANEETKQELQEISAKRSSPIKALKEKQVIKENTNPEVPALLVEKKEKFDEEQDRVWTRTLSRCWRCQSRCRFCLKRKRQFPTFANFRAE